MGCDAARNYEILCGYFYRSVAPKVFYLLFCCLDVILSPRDSHAWSPARVFGERDGLDRRGRGFRALRAANKPERDSNYSRQLGILFNDFPPDRRLPDEDDKDEEASKHVDAADYAQEYLEMKQVRSPQNVDLCLALELFSKRRWPTGSAQKYEMLQYMCCVLFWCVINTTAYLLGGYSIHILQF